MIIGGIDYSYTCPAICIVNTDDIKTPDDLKDFSKFQFHATYEDHRKNPDIHGTLGEHKNVHIELLSGNYSTSEMRFRNIKEWAAKVLSDAKVEEAVFEGFAMGSRVGLIFQIAENASVLKQWLNWRQIPFITPAPTAVKKNFSGKGNSNKIQMTAVFEAHFQINFAKDILLRDHAVVKSKKKIDVTKPQEPPRPVGDCVDAFANLICHPLILPLYEKLVKI